MGKRRKGAFHLKLNVDGREVFNGPMPPRGKAVRVDARPGGDDRRRRRA